MVSKLWRSLIIRGFKKNKSYSYSDVKSENLIATRNVCSHALSIPAKPLHNHKIISVHFNNFYCTEICDNLSRELAMFTYIYLNMDDC